MSLGNPVFTVFQAKQSRHVFFVRYKDGSIDVFSSRSFKEEFPDIDIESGGEFVSAAKAIQYAEEELTIDDKSIDVFGSDEEDDEYGPRYIEEDEDEEQSHHLENYYRRDVSELHDEDS